MKHYKGKILEWMVIILFFITMGMVLNITYGIITDSAKEDKSVYEQVCDEQSSKIGSVDGSAKLMSYELEDIATTEDTIITVAEGVEEQTEEKNYTSGWVTTNVNVRETPNTEAEILEVYVYNKEVEYADYNDEWVEIKYNDNIAYIAKEFISNEKNPEVIIKAPEAKKEVTTTTIPVETTTTQITTSTDSGLTKSTGVYFGPSGRETYYNLPMNGCIYYMQQLGYNYNYWVRNDGCKMYGDYIMIAANTNVYPKGTILPTSLGMGMVCDHCEAAAWGISSIDIATTW